MRKEIKRKAKVAVTALVSEEVRQAIASAAELEKRSIANYLGIILTNKFSTAKAEKVDSHGSNEKN